MQDYYYAVNNSQNTAFLLAQTPAPSQVDLEAAMKHWSYCTRFANHMYEVNNYKQAVNSWNM